MTRPVAQLIDGMSNFFLPNKGKTTTNRQQSVQKAMKYLREKKTQRKFKRLAKSMKENELLAKSILASSKTPRIIKKKPLDFTDENPTTSTPVVQRRKSLSFETTKTPSPPRSSRRSETQTISPISSMKKRTRIETPTKKKIILNNKKRKESRTEDEQSDDQDEPKRKLNFDVSSKSNDNIEKKKNVQQSIVLEYKNVPAFINDSLPETISENDICLFLEARKNSTKLITEVCRTCNFFSNFDFRLFSVFRKVSSFQ